MWLGRSLDEACKCAGIPEATLWPDATAGNLRKLVHLMIYDTGLVSLKRLLLSWYPSQRLWVYEQCLSTSYTSMLGDLLLWEGVPGIPGVHVRGYSRSFGDTLATRDCRYASNLISQDLFMD